MFDEHLKQITDLFSELFWHVSGFDWAQTHVSYFFQFIQLCHASSCINLFSHFFFADIYWITVKVGCFAPDFLALVTTMFYNQLGDLLQVNRFIWAWESLSPLTLLTVWKEEDRLLLSLATLVVMGVVLVFLLAMGVVKLVVVQRLPWNHRRKTGWLCRTHPFPSHAPRKALWFVLALLLAYPAVFWLVCKGLLLKAVQSSC